MYYSRYFSKRKAIFGPMVFNIPLTLIGTKLLGPRYGVKTVVAFVMTFVYVDGLRIFTFPPCWWKEKH